MEIVVFALVAGLAVGGCDMWERRHHRAAHARQGRAQQSAEVAARSGRRLR